MAAYGAAERGAEHYAEGIIAKAAKDVLRDAAPATARDAESAAARGAAHRGEQDLARSSERSLTEGMGDLETRALQPQYVGESSGDATKAFGGNVKYLDDAERRDLQLTAREGKLYDADGELFDTASAHSHWSPDAGRAIYVMDADGNVYASLNQIVGTFHHSSFLAGGEVAGAGELHVVDGELRSISTASGHYRPSREMQEQVLEVLRRQGIDIGSVVREGF